ncbi:MAG: addiction module protein [Phycisphaerales bacterium]|nr:addiction module protein [Phycisphaerales bacterium]
MDSGISVDRILGLPADERLRIVEAIWDSIAAEPESLPVTDAQKREIAARLAEYRRNPGSAIPWAEARRRLENGR